MDKSILSRMASKEGSIHLQPVENLKLFETPVTELIDFLIKQDALKDTINGIYDNLA